MMRKRIKTACLSALLLSITVQASTWDDIRAIEEAKGNPSTSAPVMPAPPAVKPAHWMSLRNGQRVNLNHWKVVVFMQSTCAYCHRFDPMLKAFSEESGLSVTAFSLDAKGDDAFPDALQATPEVMVQFFTPGMPVATPTTFLVNVHTLATYPLLQGAVDKPALASRLDEVFQVAMKGSVR